MEQNKWRRRPNTHPHKSGDEMEERKQLGAITQRERQEEEQCKFHPDLRKLFIHDTIKCVGDKLGGHPITHWGDKNNYHSLEGPPPPRLAP